MRIETANQFRPDAPAEIRENPSHRMKKDLPVKNLFCDSTAPYTNKNTKEFTPIGEPVRMSCRRPLRNTA